MYKVNGEDLTRDLRKMKNALLEIEMGLQRLDPVSETFIYEYAIYEKRIMVVSKVFNEMIGYFNNFSDKHGIGRRQLKRLIDMNNRILDKAQFLKPVYLRLSQAS